MSATVVDTDVASAILKNRVPEHLATRLKGVRLAITFVTVRELPSRRLGSERRARMEVSFGSSGDRSPTNSRPGRRAAPSTLVLIASSYPVEHR